MSKPMPSAEAASISVGATATALRYPETSVNHSRTKRMSRSSRVRRTNSCCRSMLAMIQSTRFRRVSSRPACPFDAADTRTPRARRADLRCAGHPRDAEGEMDAVLAVLVIVLLGLLVLVGTSTRVIDQFEQGVILRFGRLRGEPRGPGLILLAPGADRLHKVNMQVVTMPVPAQEGITRDNVTVKVDAVVYYKVYDPVRVVVGVQNYEAAIAQVAQASLRSIIGKSELDDLLSNRERLNQGLELMLDSPAVDWGIHIDRVDIKDVALPEAMKRSMSRQAEAERERRSRVITAEGELQASEKLAQAAAIISTQPAALQLRLLQTMVEVAAEKNSTVVLPFPVELLRFLERSTPPAAEDAAAPKAPEVDAAPAPAAVAPNGVPLPRGDG